MDIVTQRKGIVATKGKTKSVGTRNFIGVWGNDNGVRFIGYFVGRASTNRAKDSTDFAATEARKRRIGPRCTYARGAR